MALFIYLDFCPPGDHFLTSSNLSADLPCIRPTLTTILVTLGWASPDEVKLLRLLLILRKLNKKVALSLFLSFFLSPFFFLEEKFKKKIKKKEVKENLKKKRKLEKCFKSIVFSINNYPMIVVNLPIAEKRSSWSAIHQTVYWKVKKKKKKKWWRRSESMSCTELSARAHSESKIWEACVGPAKRQQSVPLRRGGRGGLIF